MAESLDPNEWPARGTTQADPCDAKPIRHDGGSMSYREVADRAATFAAALAELGVRPGERVLLMLPDGPGFVEAFVGVMQRGAVPLPVNPMLQASDVTAVAADAGARLVVASEERIRVLADPEAGPHVLVDVSHGVVWTAALRLS